MRVVSAKEQARFEKEAGLSNELLMEKAGQGIAKFIEQVVETTGLDWFATLLCGKGNNGGDAYVAGRYLLEMGYTVRAIQLLPPTNDLCQQQQQAFIAVGGEVIDRIELLDKGIILDGLLGTGFSGEVTGPFADLIAAANATTLPRFAIDIPSGITGFKADWTIYLEFPKTCFFIGDAWNYVGKLHRVPLELPEDNMETDFHMMEQNDAILPPLVRNRHKYEAGYVVGLAGSPEMPGAAILACEAALRAGAGMMRLLHPPEMKPHHLGLPAEVLAHAYTSTEDILEHMNKADAIFIGPGMGKIPDFEKILKGIQKPCVLDADALIPMSELPKNAVLTPHHGEMCRLLGRKLHGKDLLDAAKEYAPNSVLVLKGSPTFIFGPEAIVVPKGDPGMATAGAGDVLTGIIASLLAQGLSPWDAARLGVYVHAEAGEQAAFELTSRSLVASDITHHLPEAFQSIS